MKSERKPNTFLRNQKEKSEKERKKRNWRKHRTWTRRKNRKESVFLLILRKSNILLRRRFVWNHSIPEKVTANSISFEFFFHRPFALKLVDLCTFKAREKKRLGKGFDLFSHRDDVVFCPQIDRNHFKRRLLKWWFSGRKSIILWRLEAIISIKLFAIVVQIAWINSTELKSELYSFLLVLHSIESFWYEILPLFRPNSLVHWT